MRNAPVHLHAVHLQSSPSPVLVLVTAEYRCEGDTTKPGLWTMDWTVDWTMDWAFLYELSCSTTIVLLLGLKGISR